MRARRLYRGKAARNHARPAPRAGEAVELEQNRCAGGTSPGSSQSERLDELGEDVERNSSARGAPEGSTDDAQLAQCRSVFHRDTCRRDVGGGTERHDPCEADGKRAVELGRGRHDEVGRERRERATEDGIYKRHLHGIDASAVRRQAVVDVEHGVVGSAPEPTVQVCSRHRQVDAYLAAGHPVEPRSVERDLPVRQEERSTRPCPRTGSHGTCSAAQVGVQGDKEGQAGGWDGRTDP